MEAFRQRDAEEENDLQEGDEAEVNTSYQNLEVLLNQGIASADIQVRIKLWRRL